MPLNLLELLLAPQFLEEVQKVLVHLCAFLACLPFFDVDLVVLPDQVVNQDSLDIFVHVLSYLIYDICRTLTAHLRSGDILVTILLCNLFRVLSKNGQKRGHSKVKYAVKDRNKLVQELRVDPAPEWIYKTGLLQLSILLYDGS